MPYGSSITTLIWERHHDRTRLDQKGIRLHSSREGRIQVRKRLAKAEDARDGAVPALRIDRAGMGWIGSSNSMGLWSLSLPIEVLPMNWNGSQTLSRAECRKVAKLLGLLHAHLASAIESTLIPGTDDAYPPEEAASLKVDRRNWALTGRLIARLKEPPL